MTEGKQKKSIKEWAVDDRPREKAIKNGISTLSKSELLAILVGSGNDEESAVDLMKRVLESCGNRISELTKLSVDDLCTFRGIGPAKAITIVAACELWKRREGNEVFYWLNRRSQKRSYTWKTFQDMLKAYPLARPRIYVSIYEG